MQVIVGPLARTPEKLPSPPIPATFLTIASPKRPRRNTMDPTGDQYRSNQHSTPQEYAANGSQIPWAEIFSRHETVLLSHLHMLKEVKGCVSDGDAFQTVSSMLDKTMQAMNQLKIVRNSTSTSTKSKNNATETTTSQFTDTEPNASRKRPRTDNAKDYKAPTNTNGDSRSSKRKRDIPSQQPSVNSPWSQNNTEEPSASTDQTDESHTFKRKRDMPSFRQPSVETQWTQDDQDSNETEDISAEVQRRLRIKDEMRRKKESSQSNKRKRESISADNVSPGSLRLHKKRARGNVDSESGAGIDEGRARKMKKGR
ncbi:hypothetical protein N7520_007843 [Penicillium odoratum]|uniref:uncharacterized protein n=1 Tax=Penicillium odoratum TaxID=1167516 RepID=UPI0025468EDA|nr:uncharacterized protein N7520_007843 [Penicillium odoratum]KAJ5760687.1 hypothetical protein N7520_007843 [Penicillium odoratum]